MEIPKEAPFITQLKEGHIVKLIFAIVNKDDSSAVQSALTKEKFSVTKLATTGGFLLAGNTTFIIGTDDEKVEQVLGIIEENSTRRTQIVPSSIAYGAGLSSAYPIEVTVGGATIFVTDVSRFEKY